MAHPGKFLDLGGLRPTLGAQPIRITAPFGIDWRLGPDRPPRPGTAPPSEADAPTPERPSPAPAKAPGGGQ